MESILGIYLEELYKLELIDSGKPTGLVYIKDVIDLFEKFEISMLNNCDAEQIEAQLDRERSYKEYF